METGGQVAESLSGVCGLRSDPLRPHPHPYPHLHPASAATQTSCSPDIALPLYPLLGASLPPPSLPPSASLPPSCHSLRCDPPPHELTPTADDRLHTRQPPQDFLPYEEFSVRMRSSDIPHLVEVLRSYSEAQLAALRLGMAKYWRALVWERELGGLAYEWTLAGLQRRAHHLDGQYFR